MTYEELLYLLQNPYREEIAEFIPTITCDDEGNVEQFVIIKEEEYD